MALATILHALAVGTQSTGATFFVNGVTGSDSNAGTSTSSAFATIAKGLEAIAGSSQRGTAPITLSVRGGIYRQSAPLKVTANHSGTAANPVTIVGSSGTVRILGGTSLNASLARAATADDYETYFTTNFPAEYAATPASARRGPAAGAMVIDLAAAGITDYGAWSVQGGFEYGCNGAAMELFMSGEPMTVARWPNVNPDPGNSTNLVWSRTVKGSGGGGLNELDRATKAALFGVDDVPGVPLGAAHHGFKPTRRGGCKQRELRKNGISCAAQAQATLARNAKRREAWHASKGLSAQGYVYNASAALASKANPTFTYDAAVEKAFASWPDIGTAWVHGTWPYEWEDTMAPITAFSKAEKTITVGMPMPTDNGITAAAKYFVWNALSALDVSCYSSRLSHDTCKLSSSPLPRSLAPSLPHSLFLLSSGPR